VVERWNHLNGKDFENPFGLKDVKGNMHDEVTLMDMAVFPAGIQEWPLQHIIATKRSHFGEIKEFTRYTKRW